MKIRVFETTAATVETAMAEISEQVRGMDPSLIVINGNARYSAPDLAMLPPGNAVHGATSCQGSMTQRGHQIDADTGLSAFVIDDPIGDYGTSAVANNGDPRAAARQATEQALALAERDGEAPDAIWISMTPGQEEEALQGVADVVGPETPVIGGSAADNAVAGDWYLYDGAGVHTDGVVVSVLFPSTPVAFAYQNGYGPTKEQGVVTHAEGRRVIEIDNQPAEDVYARWTGGEIACSGAGAENILAQATLFPLGREVGQVQDVPYYLLAHPAVMERGQGLDLFANVEEGETLTQMVGDAAELAARAGRVAGQAVSLAPPGRPIAGALMIYCGGCMMAVQDRMQDVVAGINAALDGAPFQGAFTFGEQGPILGNGNRHGNLMISCLVFTE